LVFAGFLASAALIAQFAARRAGRNPFGGRPVIRGEGTVLRKSPLAGGGGVLSVEVAAAQGKALVAECEIPEPYWEALDPGARITVLYQTNYSQSQLRIVECGLVALPAEIR